MSKRRGEISQAVEKSLNSKCLYRTFQQKNSYDMKQYENRMNILELKDFSTSFILDEAHLLNEEDGWTNFRALEINFKFNYEPLHNLEIY